MRVAFVRAVERSHERHELRGRLDASSSSMLPMPGPFCRDERQTTFCRSRDRTPHMDYSENSLPIFLLHERPASEAKFSSLSASADIRSRLRPQNRLEIIRRYDFVINGDIVRGGKKRYFSPPMFSVRSSKTRPPSKCSLPLNIMCSKR